MGGQLVGPDIVPHVRVVGGCRGVVSRPADSGLGVEDYGVGIFCERCCCKGCPGGEAAGVCNELRVDTVLAVELGDTVRGREIIGMGNAIRFFVHLFGKPVIGTEVDNLDPAGQQFAGIGHRRRVRDCKECHIRIDGIGLGIRKGEIREPFQVGMDLVKGGSCKFP